MPFDLPLGEVARHAWIEAHGHDPAVTEQLVGEDVRLVWERVAARVVEAATAPSAGDRPPRPGDRVRYVGDRAEWSDAYRARAERDSLVVVVDDVTAGLYDAAAPRGDEAWGAQLHDLRVVARAVYVSAP